LSYAAEESFGIAFRVYEDMVDNLGDEIEDAYWGSGLED